jgi:signal transduction histidine kinase
MMQVNIVFIVVVITVLAIVILFTLLAYRVFMQSIIKEKNRQHQLEIQHQKNMLEQSVKIQESERERIAILLHDDVGNKLNILSVWLNNPHTWNTERSKDIVLKQIPELIETTRNISHSLYPVNLERLGLVLTIEEIISNVDTTLDIQFVLNTTYTPGSISMEVQLYRIIQEFLSNVIKHSKADRMLIHMRDSLNTLYVVLSDNGSGFDEKSITKGMGIQNIELRLSSMKADFKWKSQINKGCILIMSIPKS